MFIHSCHLLFDHVQFTLIHGLNIPGSYAILLLQHQTLLSSPGTFTTGCCFFFDSTSSFFLDLCLHSSPIAYWVPTDLGSSSFSVLSFCLCHPGLFNLYAEYIMRNAGLNEAQAGIKTAGRNINNLRYADDTTLTAESKELNSPLMKVKE